MKKKKKDETSIRRASLAEVAGLLTQKHSNSPRFAFFLGAGASRESGIITANEMVSYFKKELKRRWEFEASHTTFSEWIKSSNYYDPTANDYSNYFTIYEPQELGRQRYIESIIEGREPSFGYFALANLMKDDYINTVITTNFDDLTYIACTRYLPIRPIVFAYGILASELRISTHRPKVIKLHGDYLYSALKNTKSELAAQDPNMADKVRQLLTEYGLVVIGYSGSDESVMSMLYKMPETNGLYWCIKKDSYPNNAVIELLRAKNGALVEIEGFDSLMDFLLHAIGFTFPDFEAEAHKQLRQLIDYLKRIRSPHINHYLKILEDSESLYTEAARAFAQRDFDKSTMNLRSALKLRPNSGALHRSLGITLMLKGEIEQAINEFEKSLELDPNEVTSRVCLESLQIRRRRNRKP